MKEEKVKGVLDWLTLKEVKDIQKFLRLANYYQQFIKYFAVITRPLCDLVKKRLKVKLGRESGKGVQRVKRKIYKRTSAGSTRLRHKNKNGS